MRRLDHWDRDFTATDLLKQSVSWLLGTTVMTSDFDHYIMSSVRDGDWWREFQLRLPYAGYLQKLDKLVVLYDSKWYQPRWRDQGFLYRAKTVRYEAYMSWHTALVEDGTDLAAIDAAINAAKVSQAIFDWSQDGYRLRFSKQQGTNVFTVRLLGAEEAEATASLRLGLCAIWDSWGAHMLTTVKM